MGKTISRHSGDEPDRSAPAKRVAKAWAPSKRQKELVSRKAPSIAGQDHLLYKGEDLKVGRR